MKSGWFFALLFGLSIFAINSQAKTVSQEQAATVAGNFFSLYVLPLNSNPEISSVHKFPVSGSPLIYVYNFSPGWVIIPAEDAVTPVLAYSASGQFEADDYNPASMEWIQDYLYQLDVIRNDQIQASYEIAELWKNLTNGMMSPHYTGNYVDPMVHTRWNQNCLYNSLCPADTAGPCDHVYTGCVATAMGQIMAYYHFPESGNGSNSYWDYPYGTISADFSAVNYAWNAMPHWLDTENLPVAELLFHAAVSVNTDFGTLGSGAFDPDARDALVDHFYYKDQAMYVERADYTDDEWKQLLYLELDNQRPVIYGAVGRLYGHTFICDGYQAGDFFHINWGWGGIHNGYYLLDLLNPGGLNFNLYHDMIVHIEPLNSPMTEVPSGLSAGLSGTTVTLQWNPVSLSLDKLIGYNLTRNGLVLNNMILTGNSYTDLNVPEGWQTYKVNAVYYGAQTAPSEGAAVEVTGNAVVSARTRVPRISVDPDERCLIFRMPGFNDHISVRLSDMTGRILLNTGISLFDGKCELSYGTVRRGVYFLTIVASSGSFTEKVSIP